MLVVVVLGSGDVGLTVGVEVRGRISAYEAGTRPSTRGPQRTLIQPDPSVSCL